MKITLNRPFVKKPKSIASWKRTSNDQSGITEQEKTPLKAQDGKQLTPKRLARLDTSSTRSTSVGSSSSSDSDGIFCENGTSPSPSCRSASSDCYADGQESCRSDKSNSQKSVQSKDYYSGNIDQSLQKNQKGNFKVGAKEYTSPPTIKTYGILTTKQAIAALQERGGFSCPKKKKSSSSRRSSSGSSRRRSKQQQQIDKCKVTRGLISTAALQGVSDKLSRQNNINNNVSIDAPLSSLSSSHSTLSNSSNEDNNNNNNKTSKKVSFINNITNEGYIAKDGRVHIVPGLV